MDKILNEMSYNWDITALKKEGYFYRGPVKSWQIDKYGFAPRGMGDLIYNTMRKIIEENDTSAWAYEALDQCFFLLTEGKRWPDEMNQPNVKGKAKFRSQKSMTRDPWTLFYACCVHLDMKHLIRHSKPQWWLYRPKMWEWRKALLGQSNCYELLNRLPTSKKEFVVILNRFRKEAYLKIQEL